MTFKLLSVTYRIFNDTVFVCFPHLFHHLKNPTNLKQRKITEKLQVQYSVFPSEPFENILPIDFLSFPSMFVCILYIFLYNHDANIKIEKLTCYYHYHLIIRPHSSFVSFADNIFIEKVQNHMLYLDVMPFSIHSVWTKSSD